MTLENLRVKKNPAPRNTLFSSEKYDGDEIATRYVQAQGVANETSRQYTIEDEILLSARYAR
jgi:hypothetical protein